MTRGLDGSAAEPPHWSRWFRLIGVDQPQGEVVMKGPTTGRCLLLNRKGEGRVGMLLSDQGWLWARGFEGGGPHVALYRRIAHWLMKEPELEEERLTAAGRGMTLEIRRQTMSDDPGPAAGHHPVRQDARRAAGPTEPGVFTGSVETNEIGLYQIGNGDLTALAHVGPINAPEFADTVSTDGGAEAGGGSDRRQRPPPGRRSRRLTLPGVVPVRGRQRRGSGATGSACAPPMTAC